MKAISPIGIVRNSAITNNKDGNCEEILNLRPKAGRWDAVARKALRNIFNSDSASTITKYYEHKCGDAINLIVMVEGSNFVRLDWAKVITANQISSFETLWQSSRTATDEIGKATFNIDIESIGNFLCVNTPLLITFLFKDGKYNRIDSSNVKPVDVNPYFNDRMSGNGTIIQSHIDCTLTNSLIDTKKRNGDECYMMEYIGGKDNKTFYTKPIYDYSLLKGTSVSSITSDQNVEETNMPMLFTDLTYDSSQVDQFIETMGGEYQSLLNEDREHTEGYVLIRSAYEMFDGSYVYPSNPIIVHLGTANGRKNDFSNVDYSYFRDKIVIKEFHMGKMTTTKAGYQDDAAISAYVRRQNMQSLCFERPNVDVDTSIYKNIVFFVSKPLSMYDFTKVKFDYLHCIQRFMVSSDDIDVQERGDYYFRHTLSHRAGLMDMQEGFPETVPSTEEMLNQTLYKAVSFNLTDKFDKGEYCDECPSKYGKRVDFSNLINGEILNVNSSFSEYETNKLHTYDRRLHIGGAKEFISDNVLTNTQNVNFDSYNEFGAKGVSYLQCERRLLGKGRITYSCPYLINEDSATKESFTLGQNVALVFEIKDSINNIYYTQVKDYTIQFPFISFPDSRCKNAYFYTKSGSTYKKYEVTMTASATSDFSYWSAITSWDYNKSAIIAPKEMDCTKEEYDKVVLCNGKWTSTNPAEGGAETNGKSYMYMGNRLIVSNQSNPIAFPPELNFQFDDDVVTIGNSYKEISMAQDGQYPTYVFTKRGIWAMSVGVSSFYATQVSIHPDVAICRNCKGIGDGIVYVANDGIKMISGRKVSNLSEAMDGCIPKQIATNTSLVSALGDGSNRDKLNNIISLYAGKKVGYPINPCDYLRSDKIVFGFDETNNELIMCKCYENTIPRSYVFSTKFSNWFSISETFYSFSRNFGTRKAYDIDKLGNNSYAVANIYNSIVDLNKETPIVEFGAHKNEYFAPQVLMITKPLSLSSLGFKAVYHTAFRGQFYINGQSVLGSHDKAVSTKSNPHFGCYILASNDGGNYEMVGGKVFHQSVSQVVLERIKQSYRYIVLVMAGYADVFLQDSDNYGQFSITHIEMQDLYKYNNRLR